MNNDWRLMRRMLLSAIMAAVGTCAWGQNIPDAVTITQTAGDDFSYLLEGEGVVFKINGDYVHMTVNGEDEKGFTLSETDAIVICPAHAFRLKANQDPDHQKDYYSTFYTSEGAYKVPANTAAYAATVACGEDANELKLTSVGDIIPQGEAVILRAEGSSIVLMPSARQLKASSDDELENALEGTDKQKTLGADQYALSLGQAGVGFYLWDGRTIGANKAFLTLSDYPLGTKALTFRFDDGTTTAIEQPSANGQQPTDAYDLNGIRVDDGYKGFVIKDGMKFYRK